MTFSIKHFATDDLLAQYANLHHELYPQLPIEFVVDNGQPAVRSPKLLMLGSDTFVDVNGEWKNVKDIS